MVSLRSRQGRWAALHCVTLAGPRQGPAAAARSGVHLLAFPTGLSKTLTKLFHNLPYSEIFCLNPQSNPYLHILISVES